MPPRDDQQRRWWWFVLGTIAFGTSYAVLPLYSSNQNHHLLTGIARAGEGFLRDDWLVHTVDPFPLFTAFVTVVHRFLTDDLYYLLYYLLLGAYAYGLMRMVERVWPPDAYSRTTERLVFLAAICVLHNEVIGYLLGIDLRHLPWWQMTHWGVAEQEIFGHSAFQPSAIGLLLPLALAWAAEGRLVTATALIGAVLLIHFSYILLVAALTAGFVVVAAQRTRSIGLPARIVGTAVAFAVPVLAYVAWRLGPTTADTSRRAATILVQHIPQEADPAVWLGPKAALQLVLMTAGVALTSGTDLFLPLLLSLIAGVTLTSAQLASHNPQLALLFPWRVSVLLVPVSTALLLRYAIARSRQYMNWRAPRVRGRLIAASAAAIALAMVASTIRMTLNFAYFYDYGPVVSRVDRIVPDRLRGDFARALRPDTLPLMDFVRAMAAPGDLYVIPPELERFRLRAGAPVLADFKSHPYKDTEVIEWRERLRAAETFYASGGDCAALADIEARYPVTHIVFDDRVRPAECTGLRLVYSDPVFDLYRIRATADVKIRSSGCCTSFADTDPRGCGSRLFCPSCSVCR